MTAADGGRRAINGSVGLRVPGTSSERKCRPYMRRRQTGPRAEWHNDSAFSIVAQYQSEYRGVVQYYRLAYNLTGSTGCGGSWRGR